MSHDRALSLTEDLLEERELIAGALPLLTAAAQVNPCRARAPWEFTLAEACALLAVSRAVISLYRISALRPGSVNVRDLISGERLELSSEDVVSYRKKGDVLFASVVDCGDRKEFEGLDLLIPPPLVSTVSGAFRSALREARNQWPAPTDAELGCNAAPVVLRALLEVRSSWEAHEDHGARSPGTARAEGLS